MKDHIGGQLKNCTEFSQVKKLIDDSIDYYNNERYQWNLYQFYMTGEYPIEIPNPSPAPQNAKDPQILGSESSKKRFVIYSQLLNLSLTKGTVYYSYQSYSLAVLAAPRMPFMTNKRHLQRFRSTKQRRRCLSHFVLICTTWQILRRCT